MRQSSKIIITVVITFVLTMALCIGAVYLYLGNSSMRYDRLSRVISLIENKYIGDFDAEKAEKSAISSVVQSLDDKYSVYYDENSAEETMDIINGYYVGIGLEIFANTKKNKIEVLAAYDDSPAKKAGIKSGDLILSIDGKKYNADGLSDASLYMKGDKSMGTDVIGTEVKLAVLRDGKEMTFNLKRGKINIYTVKGKMMDDGIYYIKYTGFTKQSADELKKLVEGLDESEIEGLVIDVRDNPGGEFESAINICDLFLDKGVIMYTLDKNNKKEVYNAKDGSCKLPMAVLVNKSSASAAEIFAGSLQSHKRAVIVGEKTFGKGVCQTIEYINPLDKSDGALKLTTCKNYTYDGKWLNDAVTPDIAVEKSEVNENTAADETYKKAAEKLLAKEK